MRFSQNTHKTIPKSIIAFEVSKATLVVHTLPQNRQVQIDNKLQSIKRLLRHHDPLQTLVVCEATGGYERHVLMACEELELDIHRAHGSTTRAFATYRGLAAKTDAIDAKMLAEYGRDTPQLRHYQAPGPEQQNLRHLRKRRDQLTNMLRMEQNRLEHAINKRVRRSITRHIKAMQKDRLALEGEITDLITATPELKRKSKLIQSIKGVGPATAHACLAYLPELGKLTKGQVANLVGLAPIARDSGKFRGTRHIGGGRKVVRSTLYMAAVVAMTHNPVFKQYADKSRKKGKPAMVIITAIMRRLIVIINAVIKSGEPCKQNYQT